MKTIQYFNEELSIEDYVKREICKNAGTQSIAFKEEMIHMCDSLGISYDKKMSKDEIFNLLINNGCEYKQLAERFGVGVSSQVYQKAFSISHNDVKRLEKQGILKIVGDYRFRAYGKYLYAPLYDIYQYASLSKEDIQAMLKAAAEKRRGKKEDERFASRSIGTR